VADLFRAFTSIGPADHGKDVSLAGWAEDVRNLGGIAFLIVRQRAGTFQVTVVLIVGVGVVKAQLPPGYSYPPAFLTAQDWFNGSLLAQHFYGLEPLTRTIFSLVLPGSISSYFTQLLTH